MIDIIDYTGIEEDGAKGKRLNVSRLELMNFIENQMDEAISDEDSRTITIEVY